MKAERHIGATVKVVSIQEIGLDGFWTCFGKMESSAMSAEELEDAAATVYQRI